MKSLEAKIVVLGSQGVGKTSVVMRYVNNTFTQQVSPTIGASFFTCKVVLDDYRIKMQVWDTAGQERFRAMAPMYYRKATAALLVYDITSADSFEDMKKWVTELQRNVDENIVICVLGNKCDLESARQVPIETATEYAASMNALHFCTSAMENQGIDEVFVFIAQELIRQFETNPDCDVNAVDTYHPGSDTLEGEDSQGQDGGLNVSNAQTESRRTCCSA